MKEITKSFSIPADLVFNFFKYMYKPHNKFGNIMSSCIYIVTEQEKSLFFASNRHYAYVKEIKIKESDINIGIQFSKEEKKEILDILKKFKVKEINFVQKDDAWYLELANKLFGISSTVPRNIFRIIDLAAKEHNIIFNKKEGLEFLKGFTKDKTLINRIG